MINEGKATVDHRRRLENSAGEAGVVIRKSDDIEGTEQEAAERTEMNFREDSVRSILSCSRSHKK